jgi:endoglucanase
VKSDGTIEDPNSPVGFSAALLPYLSALGETNLESQQMSRVQSEFNSKSGLYGNPAKYYDQNLIMFALGWKTRQFWFDSQGTCVFRSASLGREPLPSAVQRAGSHLIDAGK